jgi:hypothetical protein
MTDEQLDKTLAEIKESYKKQVHNIFGELSLKTKAKGHWNNETTYSVEMTFAEWEAMKTRYMSF